jgi:transposase
MKTLHSRLQTEVSALLRYQEGWLTNAVAEGLNSKIMSIKRRVGGFRNRQNFKTAIFFYCGGLSLNPQ